MRTLLVILNFMLIGSAVNADVVKPSMDEDLSFSYQTEDNVQEERSIAGTATDEVKNQKPKAASENKKHNPEDEIPLRAQRFWKY